jgi:type I site-specific restriction endonuclease
MMAFFLLTGYVTYSWGQRSSKNSTRRDNQLPFPSGTASPTFTEEDDFDPEASVIGQEIIKETAVTMLARTSIIAQHLAAYLRQTGPLAKTIVFCVNQDHAERMRAALEHACSENVMRYTGYIERIVSDEGIEGKRALGHFSTPEDRMPVIVTTSRLLSTGVDIPTCKNIVPARPVGSLVEFKQIIGRGSRLHEPDKTWFTIIDGCVAKNQPRTQRA